MCSGFKQDSDVSCTKNLILFVIARPSFIYPSHLNHIGGFLNMNLFLWCEVVGLTPNPQPGGPGCPSMVDPASSYTHAGIPLRIL